ncbi:META domain-containing protein [Lacihabitans sp. CCS-44]|nr:META domain-containing protein [Lacihabitans sp. CCS-44]
MIYKALLICLLMPILRIDSCTKVEVQADTAIAINLEGKWVLKHRFLGDAIDTPCGYAVTNARDITLEVTDNTESNDVNELRITGNSAVNMYFGGLTITGFDTNTGIGSMKISTLGSTKMAGAPELMECETGYFNMLNESAEFRIQEGQLHVGRFKKDTAPSRDGGTYFIYEKAK